MNQSELRANKKDIDRSRQNGFLRRNSMDARYLNTSDPKFNAKEMASPWTVGRDSPVVEEDLLVVRDGLDESKRVLQRGDEAFVQFGRVTVDVGTVAVDGLAGGRAVAGRRRRHRAALVAVFVFNTDKNETE